LERSLYLLSRQTFPDYEVLVVEDGYPDPEEAWAIEKLCLSLPHVGFIQIRNAGAYERSPNLAWLAGYNLSSGDFVVFTHPEVMVPYHAISTMLEDHEPGRRSVPTQYVIPGRKQQYMIDQVDWKSELSYLKSLSGFWSDMGPWGWTNQVATTYAHHFSFTGQTRDEWDEYGVLPATEKPGDDDSWMHAQELSRNRPPKHLESIEVYHQHHQRLKIQDPEGSWGEAREVSVRVQRLRDLERENEDPSHADYF
jgi:hypothetical protein